MIESMQKRGSPMNAHRIATRYFESFRRERNIPAEGSSGYVSEDASAAPAGVPDAVVTTAVDSAVKKRERKRAQAAEPGAGSGELKNLHATFTPSESRVYSAIYGKSIEKKTPTLRIGLKELRELTGLSDKTVRVAVHSLEKKLSLEVVEPSLGVYGRMFFVPTPEEILRRRTEAGLEIDPTTKRVLEASTAVGTTLATGVSTAVDNAVNINIGTTVSTAVKTAPRDKIDDILSLYEFYTGNKRGARDEEYAENIKHLGTHVVEAALITACLRGKGGVAELAQVEGLLSDLGEGIPEGYLEYLRGAWNTLHGGE